MRTTEISEIIFLYQFHHENLVGFQKRLKILADISLFKYNLILYAIIWSFNVPYATDPYLSKNNDLHITFSSKILSYHLHFKPTDRPIFLSCFARKTTRHHSNAQRNAKIGLFYPSPNETFLYRKNFIVNVTRLPTPNPSRRLRYI